LRRILRRSTITSESSDIDRLPKYQRAVPRRPQQRALSIHQWPLNLKKTWFTTAPANFTSPGGRGEDQQQKKAPASTPGPSFAANAMSACLLVLVAVLERGAQDVAQRRARIGRAVLRDGLLLFGDFQRLDRDLHLARLLVELDHPRIDL